MLFKDIYDNYAALYERRTLIHFIVKCQKKSDVFKTMLQSIWRLLEPVSEMLIYYFLIVIIFRRGAKAGINPFVMLMLGISHYRFMSMAVTQSCSALLANDHILMQLKIEPLVFTAVGFYRKITEFVVIFLLYVTIFIFLGPGLSWKAAFYPPLLLMLFVLTWALSIMMSSLTVFFRDLAKMVGILLRILMYLSPVVYMLTFVPKGIYRQMVLYNPFGCLFALFQWSLLTGPIPSRGPIISLIIFCVTTFFLSHITYNHLKTKFTKAF